jgi:hypothetical protein
MLPIFLMGTFAAAAAAAAELPPHADEPQTRPPTYAQPRQLQQQHSNQI